MNLESLVNTVINKDNFLTIQNYIDFALRYLDFIPDNLQAKIVSQNENNYHFFQYKKDGTFNITRPINSNLMYKRQDIDDSLVIFKKMLKDIQNPEFRTSSNRNIINNVVYTMQQSIGAALDALPANKSNTARKINGDLFERLILLLLNKIGIVCRSGVVQIPIKIDGEIAFKWKYQHDIIIEDGDETLAIGSVKTSSKDRIDKIFIDKFLYNRLIEKSVHHFAIFLNDVQRKNTKKPNKYGINSTFLSGHFKGYTVKLNPLDGVYYCDIRPNMLTEDILKDHIKTFDHLIMEDVWNFLR